MSVGRSDRRITIVGARFIERKRPVRFTIIALVACVTVAFLCLAGSGNSPTVAQAQTAAQDVDPKILAFIKPVEIAEADSPLQKKLKERHNVAVRLLDERVNEYKKGVRDATQVFDAARLT